MADIPKGLDIHGGWVFDSKKISAHLLPPEDLQAQAATQKQQLMTQALLAMLLLQNTVKLKMATDAEATALSAWGKYSVLLSRVDLEKP